jgi:hypothetical protein
MPTSLVRTKFQVGATYQNDLSFGPWIFERATPFDLFLAVEIQIAATTLAQIIGGANPSIAAITTIQFLVIQPDQNVKIGLHGVNAQSSGFSQVADGVIIMDNISMTSLNIYNTASVTTTIFVGVGGTA